MRLLLFIIFLLTFVACRQNYSPKTLVTDNLRYSAYYWRFNQQTDSFEFYLVHFIDIDKNGRFNLIRHDNLQDSSKYFSGIVNEAVWQLIDTSFTNDKFKTNYSYMTNPNIIYDGFTYCLDYKIDNNNHKQIIFIPHNCPDKIKILGDVLDTLIYNAKTPLQDTLDIRGYTKILKKLANQIDPPPPPPSPPPPVSNAKVVLFKPSKIN